MAEKPTSSQGPWRWDGPKLWRDGESYDSLTNPRLYVGIMATPYLIDSPDMKKTMAKILAVHDLLAACQTASELLYNKYGIDEKEGTESSDCLTQLRAAISKATA